MGIKVELDQQLEKEFRQLAMKKFGYSKGSIKKATETAIRQWTETEFGTRPTSMSEERRESKAKTAVDLLTGLLKDTRHKSSTEEQHEVRKLWANVARERARRK
jgi:hypothetical protein